MYFISAKKLNFALLPLQKWIMKGYWLNGIDMNIQKVGCNKNSNYLKR